MPGRTSLKRTTPSYQRQRAGGFVGSRSRSLAMGKARAQPRHQVAYGSFGETKYFDAGINADLTVATGVWTGSEVQCVNFINSDGITAAYSGTSLLPSEGGSGYGQVNGNRFHLKKIRVRGSISADASAAAVTPGTGLAYRIMLIHDSAPNGAQAQGEVIMQDIGTDHTLWSFKNMAGSGSRFRILKDQLGILPATTVVDTTSSTGRTAFGTAEFSFQYQPTVPLNISVKSNASADPTVANLVDGNIFLLFHSNGKPMTIHAVSRAYYADK